MVKEERMPVKPKMSTWSWLALSVDNNINSQQDATITHFIDKYNQLNMFWTKLSPETCWADCNYQWNVLLLHLVGCLYYCINDPRSQKHQILSLDFENDCVWRRKAWMKLIVMVYAVQSSSLKTTTLKNGFNEKILVFGKRLAN